MKNITKSIVQVILITLVSFLLSYLMIIIVFGMPGMYDGQETIGTYVGIAMIALSGFIIIGLELLFHFITKKKNISRRNSIITLLITSVLYAILMIFAYEPMLVTIPSLIPKNNELASGYTVFFIQIFTISGATICFLVNLIRLLIKKKE